MDAVSLLHFILGGTKLVNFNKKPGEMFRLLLHVAFIKFIKYVKHMAMALSSTTMSSFHYTLC